ncbi:5-methyltetrahydropteroyltriglutamate--homocysteine methyltransferase [Halocalculus aciditolerans]|uniref:Cobalamin-independent methionine synthase MetE N-terminal domain-containing protein n=1 Tax=Halocalculus aciditolerans TaxID=1383812 RepID=A0A830FH52_9EURY|nr:5-methyltetrahydropteroyltriglutamate--homocysteine methyltransferase [Halocalculus aciditolerans]GGL54814.1 hypothetical protein GCM10009039_11150 [Halocalculus aciditolerans]
MPLTATTLGLFPLPDDARETLADLKGHQKGDLVSGDEPPEIEAVYDDARATHLDTQQAAGLDLHVEGQARWDDMLAHPLTVNDAVDTGGIVRYYDNNNFYRDPIVTDALEASGDVARDLERAGEHTDSLQAVLPGPYSLAELATDDYYGDDADFLAALGDFLAGEAAEFPDVDALFLLEPSLATDPPGDGPDARASDAIDTVASAVDAPVIVQSYWGALPDKVYAHLLDADIDGVGLDLVSAPDDNAVLVGEYGAPDAISLGLVDGQNTLVESPDIIEERLDWFTERLPGMDFTTTYLTPNTELFHLPTNKFEAKLDALATAADRVDATEVDA